MSHFAKVEDGIVTQVLVVEKDFIDTGALGDPSLWIQTSYNTFMGEHPFDGIPLRKNFASVGYTYDAKRDAFIPPNPCKSWVLNEFTCVYEPPHPYPDDGEDYQWDEETISWRPAPNKPEPDDGHRYLWNFDTLDWVRADE